MLIVGVIILFHYESYVIMIVLIERKCGVR